MHILAGTGHGKTQTLQHLIVSDLQRPSDEVPSMVILDSQGDMLNTIKRLSLFDPMIIGSEAASASLARRLLIVDPSDVHFAPALNLFDIQSDRLKNYNQRDREQVLAGIIEIYEYIFGGLLGAELTQKKAMVFGFLAELMLAITLGLFYVVGATGDFCLLQNIQLRVTINGVKDCRQWCQKPRLPRLPRLRS
ncbi:MAG: hypothetical protein GXP11_09865 [Gammaproteobacteria bacterium]|nr:hypothetical protein [Gammaproteobacteria bacterium]